MADLDFDRVNRAALEGFLTRKNTLAPLLEEAVKDATESYAQSEREREEREQELNKVVEGGIKFGDTESGPDDSGSGGQSG